MAASQPNGGKPPHHRQASLPQASPPHRVALEIDASKARDKPLWRAGLPALGREAALKSAASLCQMECSRGFYGCFAAERGQAPSPQASLLATSRPPSPQVSPLATSRPPHHRQASLPQASLLNTGKPPCHKQALSPQDRVRPEAENNQAIAGAHCQSSCSAGIGRPNQ